MRINEDLLEPYVSNQIADAITSGTNSALEIESYAKQSGSNYNRGHIKFKNGFQIAWMDVGVGTVNITSHYSSKDANPCYIGYGDVTINTAWSNPFTAVYHTWATSSKTAVWTENGDASTTTGGWVRCFNESTYAPSIYIKIFAIGKGA